MRNLAVEERQKVTKLEETVKNLNQDIVETEEATKKKIAKLKQGLKEKEDREVVIQKQLENTDLSNECC